MNYKGLNIFLATLRIAFRLLELGIIGCINGYCKGIQPVSEYGFQYQRLNSGEPFYGVKLDKGSPYLKRNLARLEIWFQERFQSSVDKGKVRSEQGKAKLMKDLQRQMLNF